MPGMSLDQPVPCQDCNGSGISRYASGMGGQRVQCSKCSGTGNILACQKCGAGLDEECDCAHSDLDMMPEELDVDTCPECGAPLGEPHDPRCPLKDDFGPDTDRYRESVDFDKFMDRIVIEENRKHKIDVVENNPQRQIARKYQDRPGNRTVILGARVTIPGGKR